jgi:hypothetical protein
MTLKFIAQEIRAALSQLLANDIPSQRLENQKQKLNRRISLEYPLYVSRSTPVVGATANLSDVSRIFSRERFDRFPPN